MASNNLGAGWGTPPYLFHRLHLLSRVQRYTTDTLGRLIHTTRITRPRQHLNHPQRHTLCHHRPPLNRRHDNQPPRFQLCERAVRQRRIQ